MHAVDIWQNSKSESFHYAIKLKYVGQNFADLVGCYFDDVNLTLGLLRILELCTLVIKIFKKRFKIFFNIILFMFFLKSKNI